MERPMNKAKLPKTNSIQELADFWDTHDLTDFEEALEEVRESVFERAVTINVPLDSCQVKAVEQCASGELHLESRATTRDESPVGADGPVREIARHAC